MATESISFDTGLKSFEINGKCEVTFNPFDIFFLGRITDTAERLSRIQDDLQTATAGNDWAIIYAKSKEADAKMREEIDALFGAPVSDAIFPGLSVFALGDGFPLWYNLFVSVVDKMDSGLDAEKERSKVRLKAYTEKYKRK